MGQPAEKSECSRAQAEPRKQARGRPTSTLAQQLEPSCLWHNLLLFLASACPDAHQTSALGNFPLLNSQTRRWPLASNSSSHSKKALHWGGFLSNATEAVRGHLVLAVS